MHVSRIASILVATAAIIGVAAGPAAAVNPQQPTVATATVDNAELAELIRLSDPATLTDLHEGQQRMERIADIFAAKKDRRGIFAIFYRNILRDANPLLDAGRFDDPQWARAVSAEFFHRYLENLHGNLTGGTVTPTWQRYYAMAADPSRSAGRVAAAGLDAHLLIDFPQAIAATDTGIDHTRDFLAIGDSLINTTSHITDELQSVYGANLAGFFHLYFLGKGADLIIGQGNTSYVMFQSVRGTALASGIAMQEPVTRQPAEIGMHELYNTAETVFNGLEALNLI
ncbi:DUF5995 family protein [Nocardia sp. NPDC051030]|uniref:DUF5995 family protein n=1 Tax=Nocardia sp. NPDC051030 TaxID=3155162 RepID=UPI0034177B54